MDRWTKVRLGDVLIHSTNTVIPHDELNYKLVTVKMHNKGVMLRREVIGSEIKSTRMFCVQSGQFILSRIDARNGAFGIIPSELDGALVTNDFPVFNIERSRVDLDFLKWMVRTHDFIDMCKRASEGTTNRVRLKEDKFLNLTVPLPPLPEQRRIVAKIEKLTDKIEEAKGLRRGAIEEAEALILSGLKHILKYRNSWEIMTISACSTMNTGTTPPSGRSDYYEGDLQWYTPGDLGYSPKLGCSSRTVSDRAIAENKVRIFEPGTVLLVAIGSSLGKMGLAHERCSSNQQITGIKFFLDILPEYGFWWMRSLYNELRTAASQATLPIINQRRIGEFKIAIPPFSEQHRMVGYLDHLKEKIDNLKRLQHETQSELDALTPSILAKAFRGEL